MLAGVDDGARDLADSVAMARQAQADGIVDVCATPHIRHDHDVRIHELPERLAALAGAIAEAGCTTRVLPGGEVAVSALRGLDREELGAVSLGGGGRWILLEPDPGPLDDRLDQAVDRLRGDGFRALIAHPERHVGPDLPLRLSRLTERGALVQATAAFFVGEETREGMLTLARLGLVHVLGSDAHSGWAGRPVALTPALEVLRTVPRLAPHAEWIATTAPHAIVRGEDVATPF